MEQKSNLGILSGSIEAGERAHDPLANEYPTAVNGSFGGIYPDPGRIQPPDYTRGRRIATKNR